MSHNGMLRQSFDDYLRTADPKWREPFGELLDLVSANINHAPTSEDDLRDQVYDILFGRLSEAKSDNWKGLMKVVNGWHVRVPLFV